MRLDSKKLIKIFVLFILTIVVSINAEGASKTDDALEVVRKYQEFIRKAEWLEQSKLIIKEELDAFKTKLVSIPGFNALNEKTSNEIYAIIHSAIMKESKVDKSELIGFVEEGDDLVHAVVRHTVTSQNIKNSNAKLLTLRYINNEWKISAEVRLNILANMMKMQKLASKINKPQIEEPPIQKPETEKPEKQEPETQK
jgi:hypothetical protein